MYKIAKLRASHNVVVHKLRPIQHKNCRQTDHWRCLEGPGKANWQHILVVFIMQPVGMKTLVRSKAIVTHVGHDGLDAVVVTCWCEHHHVLLHQLKKMGLVEK